MTETISIFTNTMHNEDNAELKLFSFKSLKQCIQSDFIMDFMRTLIHTMQGVPNTKLTKLSLILLKLTS